MKNLDIIIPVKNEEGNILPLVRRIDKVMVASKIPYRMIFVDDHSTDKTVEILEYLEGSYPIRIYKKQGKIGKSYSILEGVRYSDSEFVVMLDADLQYPPEAIPEMYAKAADNGVVVGNRKDYEVSNVRKFISRVFGFAFGKLLHGFKVDVQSGLKLFRREILDFIDEKDITPWTLDLSLLNTARNLGFKITGVDITFAKRTGGHSKVNLVKTSAEIGKNALKLKFQKKKTYLIKPVSKGTMAGAGVVHNKKWLKTHTTLHPKNSALQSFTFTQVIFILITVISLEVGFIFSPIITLISIVGILSFIYFIDVLFNFYVVLKSLHYPPEIVSSEREIAALKDEELPVYTILCPLYREAQIVPHFLEAIAKLNYPKDKLDVKLLLEEDDNETIEEVKSTTLPGYVSAMIVPDSEPKTKPKACNYGLNFATGEYLVVYDAEDQPEPDQLKKAYLAFKKSKPNIICLQAKLNYFNPHQNLLTRFFTAEYSLWFDVMLTGLQSVDTVIPLGGTSNHFKTKTLMELEGWDPFNVTEDCDLGVRLFKKGYKTAIIDSTTLEEANSNPKNWLRQRSRWIKGYMQTYLVHMRNPFEFIRHHGWHAFIFQLIIGARISFKPDPLGNDFCLLCFLCRNRKLY
ncbi:glycosyltransferase [Candidatus Daviesbacteria bacterium]|nr:glycosyltransferase [Candidatus Daviesbacteria bacterium]